MLSQETIENLNDMLDGDEFHLTKDSHRETLEVTRKLYNLGFLTKEKHKYVVKFKNRKHLKRLVELNSWKEFNNWLDHTDEEKKSSNSVITNNIHNSSVGQINQASDNSLVNSPKNETQKSLKKSWLYKLFLWVSIIGVIIGAIIGLYQIFGNK